MQNNSISITGKLLYKPEEACWYIQSSRNSGTIDTLKLVKNNDKLDFIDGKYCSVKGTILTRPYTSETGKHLFIAINVEELLYTGKFYDGNFACVSGEIVKDVILRKTPAGKIISDFLLKFNNKTNSVLPCIAWGSVAELVSALDKNAYIKVYGRLQSREYQKVINGSVITKVAYELCVNKVIEG